MSQGGGRGTLFHLRGDLIFFACESGLYFLFESHTKFSQYTSPTIIKPQLPYWICVSTITGVGQPVMMGANTMALSTEPGTLYS